MFGIMFGDYGHGSLIFFGGFMLVMLNDWLKKIPSLTMILKLRYLLLLMGMFSMYNGLLYNEFFAIPNDWFGSCYNTTVRNTTANNFGADGVTVSTNFVYPPNLDPPSQFYWVNYEDCQNFTTDFPDTNGIDMNHLNNSCNYQGHDCVYPFGTDPAWYLSPNMLTFVNSIKMRMAVIIGVAHMCMGISVKGLNAIFNGQYLVLFFEVCTGLVILLGLFGWMDFLIIYKWAFYPLNVFSTNPKLIGLVRNDPAVITVMINNFLQVGTQSVYFFGPV